MGTKQTVNNLIKERHESCVPDVSGTVGWASPVAAPAGRPQRSPKPRLRATGRVQPCCRKRYSKANDAADNKTKKAAAWPRNYADRPVPLRHKRSRGHPRNFRLLGTKEALSYGPNCSSFGLSVMHRYVRDRALPCQQDQIVKDALWTVPGSTKLWHVSARRRRISLAICALLHQRYPECSREIVR